MKFQLDALLAEKKREIQHKKRLAPMETFFMRPFPELRDFASALRKPGISLIAEMKRKSPSGGSLNPHLIPSRQAKAYAEGGASAISVLTDRAYFGGKESDLLEAKKACALPILRKEFILDPYQIAESRVLAADAILLIVRILSKKQMQECMKSAEEWGLACLVEVHDEKELDLALELGASIIGINNRDLATLSIDIETSLRLVSKIPDTILKVSESGIRTAQDLRMLQQAGFDAVLVGESILRAKEVQEQIRSLLSSP